jgi:DNA-binding response OmpR family regulator
MVRILMAEDDAASREVLELNLEAWNYDTVVCENGAQAWTALQEPDAPRLVILDWMMPELSGLEVCQRVRRLKNGQFTYIILLTAKGQREDLVAGLEAGADDYVVKPFDRQELKARIRVGARVVELQNQLLESEQLRVLAETAGATAHEINQPLTVLMGKLELLLEQLAGDSPHREVIQSVYGSADRIADIVRNIGQARAYVTKTYIPGLNIVDFNPSEKEG